MRPWFALAWFTLSILGTGCALVQDATHNVVASVQRPLEAHHEKARNRQWAEAAWLSICPTGKSSYSRDYARGFKDGYAEYLFRGGDGEVPLAPPRHYRNIRYQTPEGYSAIQDWFNGYRHGTVVARDSGARQWITGPPGLKLGLNEIVAPGLPPGQAGPPTQPIANNPDFPITFEGAPVPVRARISGAWAAPP